MATWHWELGLKSVSLDAPYCRKYLGLKIVGSFKWSSKTSSVENCFYFVKIRRQVYTASSQHQHQGLAFNLKLNWTWQTGYTEPQVICYSPAVFSQKIVQWPQVDTIPTYMWQMFTYSPPRAGTRVCAPTPQQKPGDHTSGPGVTVCTVCTAPSAPQASSRGQYPSSSESPPECWLLWRIPRLLRIWGRILRGIQRL